MVGHHVAVVGELFIAEGAYAALGDNLLVHQLSHFRVRADLAITSRVMGIVDPAYSQLALASFSRDRFPAAAELRAVNWAQLISAESHGFLQFGVEGIDQGEPSQYASGRKARARIKTYLTNGGR